MRSGAAAPTTPVSWVREPACSATGVREEEADTGKPPRRPPAIFASPIPDISWLPDTLSPRRAARERDSTAVSANATSAMPAAGSASEATSAHVRPPSAGAGRPCGSAPTTGNDPDSPKIAVIAVATTTTTSTPGTGDRSSLSAKMTTSEPMPNAIASAWTSPAATPLTIDTTSGRGDRDSIEKPSSFGTCDTITSSATALRYPTRMGLDSRSVTKPRRRRPPSRRIAPTMIASSPASATARSSLPSARGRTDAAMMGASAESGPSTRTRDGPNTA